MAAYGDPTVARFGKQSIEILQYVNEYGPEQWVCLTHEQARTVAAQILALLEDIP